MTEFLGNTLEDSPCPSVGGPCRTINSLKKAETLYSDSNEFTGINTHALSVASPLSLIPKHPPVRLSQAMFSPHKTPAVNHQMQY